MPYPGATVISSATVLTTSESARLVASGEATDYFILSYSSWPKAKTLNLSLGTHMWLARVRPIKVSASFSLNLRYQAATRVSK
jgi:hypothetical protein